MNIVLWVVQGVLALHTAVGALWKFSNAAQTVPELQAIPHTVWIAMAVVELLCSVCLIVPALSKRLAVLAPVAAAYIAAEMLLYCGLQVGSGRLDYGHLAYWLVVAAVAALVVVGRFTLRPLPKAIAAHARGGVA